MIQINTSETFFRNLPEVYRTHFKIMKDFTVIANFDYQIGGKFFSLSDMWGTFSGLTAKTSGLNDKGIPIRDPVADGGGVHVFGVMKLTYSPVDYYVEGSGLLAWFL